MGIAAMLDTQHEKYKESAARAIVINDVTPRRLRMLSNQQRPNRLHQDKRLDLRPASRKFVADIVVMNVLRIRTNGG